MKIELVKSESLKIGEKLFNNFSDDFKKTVEKSFKYFPCQYGNVKMVTGLLYKKIEKSPLLDVEIPVLYEEDFKYGHGIVYVSGYDVKK